MSTEILHFLLGTLFAYGISLNIHPLTKVVSFTIFFYFTFTRIHEFEFPCNVHKLLVWLFFMLIEQRVVTQFITIPFITQIGTFIMLGGYAFTIYSVFYRKGKDGKYTYMGPYGKMRHPCYFGIIVYVCGCVLFLRLFIVLFFGFLLFKDDFLQHVAREENDIIKEDPSYKKYRGFIKMFGFI